MQKAKEEPRKIEISNEERDVLRLIKIEGHKLLVDKEYIIYMYIYSVE